MIYQNYLDLSLNTKIKSMIRYVLLLGLFFTSHISYTQQLTPHTIEFKLINKSTLELKEDIKIDALKFYISNAKYIYKNELVYKPENFYHLINLSSDTFQIITSSIPFKLHYDELELQLGIDSSTNNMGVQAGDLDPMMGMYWSWQSGYINIKIEGTSSRCNTRQHKYHFHLGGFLPNQYTEQIIRTSRISETGVIYEIDIMKFFSSIDLAKENSVMIPGKEAIELSKKITNCFE